MPNHADHGFFGALAGVGGALAWVPQQEGTNEWARVLGGLCGGYLGGVVPDWIDPPRNPNHRSLAHAIMPVGTIAHALYARRTELVNHILSSDQPAGQPVGTDPNGDAFIRVFVAGVVAGFAGGYLSHLVLDLTTPRGLPVF